MKLLQHLLTDDPATPRLTVYDQSTGARMDFSAQTLDNWACKIANMLEEELELAPGDSILIDLPVSWQQAVIALGALTAGIDYVLGSQDGGAQQTTPDAVFSTVDNAHLYPDTDVVVVTDDPFGRGVEEIGAELPPGSIDFGPVVRFYGDQYFGTVTPLPALVQPLDSPQRLLSTGWSDNTAFSQQVLAPLAAGGSAVVVAGLVSGQRLEEIAQAEKTTATACQL